MWNADREVAPIDITDVSGRHGRCNNRHYTVVASGSDRARPARQPAAYRRDGNELSAACRTRPRLVPHLRDGCQAGWFEPTWPGWMRVWPRRTCGAAVSACGRQPVDTTISSRCLSQVSRAAWCFQNRIETSKCPFSVSFISNSHVKV